MHKVVSLPAYKALRLSWIRRRARRLQRSFCAERAVAVAEATLDWYRFKGRALPNRIARRVQEALT